MQIQCPGCKAKLQLPDEIKPGSRVQCPTCKKVLALPSTPAGVPGKPAAAKPEPAPAPPPPQHIEEDEDAGMYGVRKDPDLDDEEEEEVPTKGKSKGTSKAKKKKRPDINFAPDMSIKDLRGPAMILVVPPSNYMMMQCGLVIVTTLASIAMSVWPFIFMDRVLPQAVALKPFYQGKTDKKDTARFKRIEEGWVTWPALKKGAKEDDAGFRGDPMTEVEYEAAKEELAKHLPFAVAWLTLSFLILGYTLTVAFAAVKMQSLESYAWSMTGAIIAMLPFGAIGLLAYFFKPTMDFQDLPIILFVLAVEAVFTFLVGLMAIAVLLKNDVKLGFAYRSDATG